MKKIGIGFLLMIATALVVMLFVGLVIVIVTYFMYIPIIMAIGVILIILWSAGDNWCNYDKQSDN